MKPSMTNVVLLCMAAGSSGLAMAKSGEVSIIQCGGGEAQVVATSPQHSFGTYKSYATVRTNPAGGLFDMMSSQCQGASRTSEGKPTVWGHCEWADKDGDKVLLHFIRSEGLAGKFEVVHGTGKFSGIRGTRDYQITPFPAIAGARAVCDKGKLRYTLPD